MHRSVADSQPPSLPRLQAASAGSRGTFFRVWIGQLWGRNASALASRLLRNARRHLHPSDRRRCDRRHCDPCAGRCSRNRRRRWTWRSDEQSRSYHPCRTLRWRFFAIPHCRSCVSSTYHRANFSSKFCFFKIKFCFFNVKFCFLNVKFCCIWF